jgi:signal transduction histidine kinase
VALRAPLLVKVVGANLAVLIALSGAWLLVGGWNHVTLGLVLTIVALAAIHFVVVSIALRPIRDLEEAASRVWRGDSGARVQASAVADDEVLRVGATFNLLLDGLQADGARMRKLASDIIAIGDRERAALARELHESTAQRLAALLLEISSAARDTRDPELVARLESWRDTAQDLTEEVRLLAHTVHPAVLDDLGLVPALQKLAREASHGTGIDVDVEAPRMVSSFPAPVNSVLYRVAQESVRNAARHASPRRIHITLSIGGGQARLEVRDDGSGFDLAEAEHRRPGMGLFTMRERVALLDGRFDIQTAPGNGTSVVATVPLDEGMHHDR